MSLVGPRPERPDYVQLVRASTSTATATATASSPGLTGWAQVHGLRGDTSLADRVEWDNYYIENWRLWLDLKILLITVPALLGATTRCDVGPAGRRLPVDPEGERR